MSGTTVASAAKMPASGSPASAGRFAGWRTPAGAVIAVTTLLALALRLYQFAQPGYLSGLTEYDDGSYFGSAVHLTQGILPYRDFVFVQPPGITLLMTPAALVAKAAGTAAGMVIGRVLTVLASAAGVALLGLLVRHRGALATLLACGTLAVFPDSIAASHTVLVEAWLTLFCLLGAVAVFDADGLAGNRRLLWGGVAFGFAGAVEAWAIVPVLVVFALTLPRIRRAALLVAGVVVGFGVPTLPFAALSPKGFYDDLITAQIAPRAAAHRVPLWMRVREMTGLSDLSPAGHANLVISRLHLPQVPVVAAVTLVLAVVAVGGFVAAARRSGSRPAALDWFALVTPGLVAVMFMWPSQFHYHFSAFMGPFLGLAVALPAARLAAWPRAGAERAGAQRLRLLAPLAAGLMVAAFAIIQAGAESRLKPYVSPAKISAVARQIPPGACVATDSASLLVLSNRLVTNVPGCSPVLDGLGTDLALSGGLKPATGASDVPAVRQVWQQAFDHAQYVWLTSADCRRIAWNPSLRAYFTSHFRQVPTVRGGDSLYRRGDGPGVRPVVTCG